MPWRAEVVAEGDDAVEVVFEIELLLTPLRLERRVRLERGRRVIALRERLSNAGRTEVEFIWGHHPAMGAPFLSPACRLDAGARELVVDATYASPFLPLEPGSRVAWRAGFATSSPSCRRTGRDETWWATSWASSKDGGR